MDNKELELKIEKILNYNFSGLKKVVLSKFTDKNVIRKEGRVFSSKGKIFFQIETFTKDGKALHENIEIKNAAEKTVDLLMGECKQLNVVHENGSLEAKISNKGKLFVSDKIKLLSSGDSETDISIKNHNNTKKYILQDGSYYDFLYELGISDTNGNVFDKKQSKFKQINRFLEYVEDIYRFLPENGEIYVLDLCCGKSYLTFAVYYYLHNIKGRNLNMVGIDLKQDVIEHCSEIAQSLGYDNLRFVCGDIIEYTIKQEPDLIVSLHACDIATDIVMAKTITSNAKVLLSTPCCHHEMYQKISKNALHKLGMDVLADNPLLKQKFCDVFTDAVRCKILNSFGYKTRVTELVDPEETPKNTLIIGIKETCNELMTNKAYDDYCEIESKLGYTPYLGKLVFKKSDDK